jgi:hypothetical protein
MADEENMSSCPIVEKMTMQLLERNAIDNEDDANTSTSVWRSSQSLC